MATCAAMAKIRAQDLCSKKKKERLHQLDHLIGLSQLRVAKVMDGLGVQALQEASCLQSLLLFSMSLARLRKPEGVLQGRKNLLPKKARACTTGSVSTRKPWRPSSSCGRSRCYPPGKEVVKD